ncbi:MAG: amidohydrolase family protein [Chitinispirillaceae bacterium]|nr:amidohydrolase family protein [Chitinispirillaceae bacterium]
MTTVYFARWLLLDSGEIIENGAVAVSGSRIAAAGTRGSITRKHGDRLVNLGDALLLPGFINMHTHLEECPVRGALPVAGETFAAFSAKKNSRVRQTAPETLAAGIRLSVRELLAEGVTSVLDSSRSGVSPAALAHEPIRSWVIHELHAEDPAEDAAAIDAAVSRIGAYDRHVGRAAGPYAIHSLAPQTQRMLLRTAVEHRWLWAMHIAESAEELQAFSERTGDLYFYMTRKKKWPFGETTLGSMHCALTANLIPNNGICFHCNYANGHELSLLAAKRASVIVCFCYSEAMGHKRFPVEIALNRHVPLCLGTEGIASVGEMSILDELFALKNAYPHIPARVMLAWVTQNAANALRMGDRLGSLSDGKLADLIAVRFSHDPRGDILEELIVSDVEMALVMVNGQEVIANY